MTRQYGCNTHFRHKFLLGFTELVVSVEQRFDFLIQHFDIVSNLLLVFLSSTCGRQLFIKTFLVVGQLRFHSTSIQFTYTDTSPFLL